MRFSRQKRAIARGGNDVDKINLDFEACTVEIINDNQQGVETCAELSARKNAILKAMGYTVFDLTHEMNQINNWINGGPEPDFFKGNYSGQKMSYKELEKKAAELDIWKMRYETILIAYMNLVKGNSGNG